MRGARRGALSARPRKDSRSASVPQRGVQLVIPEKDGGRHKPQVANELSAGGLASPNWQKPGKLRSEQRQEKDLADTK